MKNNGRKALYIAAAGLAMAFVLWTAIVRLVDVRAIGPQESMVGLSTLNAAFHRLTGVNMALYTLTDWLGLVPVAFALSFAVLGLAQWIKRKSILKVDNSILVLGVFYTVTVAAYLFFEAFAVNYRPVLINGRLEASYPSSTTLLVLCVMPTAIMQLRSRLQNKALKWLCVVAIATFTIFMVVSRLVCGVHWLTDIVGGALLSACLVLAYRAFTCK